MVSLAETLSFGTGLFCAEEAAFYARIHPATMKRWLDGGTSGNRVFQSEMAEHADQKFATFLDFVQAMAIRSIRTRPGAKISLQKIRATVNYAESRGVRYPFARVHTTFWDGRDIHIKVNGTDYVQATGVNIHQASLSPIVETYMLDLTFNPETGLANRFRAFTYNGCDIFMDPEIRFGEPVVESCGYTARTLWEAVETEGSIDAAAHAYGLKSNEVECAIRYQDFLIPKAA